MTTITNKKSVPTASTILRSRNLSKPDKVLSTLLVRMPRSVLSEWNTHRVFSRNAASTRAIPTSKLIQQVKEDPFIPLVWGLNAKGMQAVGVHDDPITCEKEWLEARDSAVNHAEKMLKLGLHKQVIGRILEPWMWVIVCVSSTEWENFLTLRDHSDADPSIDSAAKAVRKCLEDESTIQDLNPGEWHLPFINEEEKTLYSLEQLQKLSMARCASTSYKTTDGFDMTMERAEKIFEKLVSADIIHASPTEHVAEADSYSIVKYDWENPKAHRNFVGFNQYRALLEY